MKFSLPVRIVLAPIRFVTFTLWLVPALFLSLMGEGLKADNGFFFIIEWGNEE